MQKTSILQLPIYNTPDVDTFNVADINTAHQNLEAMALGLTNNPDYITLINDEVEDARTSTVTTLVSDTVGHRIDGIDTSLTLKQPITDNTLTTTSKTTTGAINEVNASLEDKATQILSNGINVKFPPSPLVACVCDGVADDTVALNAISEYVRQQIIASNFEICPRVLIPGGKIKLTDTVTFSSFVHMQCLGFVMIESYVVNKPTIHFTAQVGDPNFLTVMGWQQYQITPYIEGGMLIKSMLDKATNLTTGLEIGSITDLGVKLNTARYNLENVAIEDFDVALQLNKYNNYIATFKNLQLTECNTLIKFGVTVGNVSNSGENFSFYGCLFANSTIGFDYYTDGFQCNFYGCSFDFNVTLFNFRRGYKKVGIFGGHIEGGTTIADATLSADVTYPQFYMNNPNVLCDSLTLFKGKMRLICDNVKWTRSNSTYDSLYICDNDVIAKELQHVYQGHDVALSPVLNLIYNSKFQKSDISGGDAVAPFTEYTVSVGSMSVPVVTATIPVGSSYTRALKTTSTADSNSYLNIIVQKYTVKPGDVVQFCINTYLSSVLTHNVKLKLDFYDKLDNLISAGTFYGDIAGALPNKWNSAFMDSKSAPSGSASVIGTISVSGLLTGEIVYVGEIYLGIS